jgi:competence protein ComEA
MSELPPFVLPEGRRARMAGLLAAAGRQRAAVAVLVLAALLGAGVVWLRAAPHLTVPAADEPAGAAAEPLPRALPEERAGDRVAVHVTGRVRRPGMVRLAAGSRVQDAIRAAGGAAAGADLDAVNLARKLVDGEQVRVPARGEPAAAAAAGLAGPGGAAGSGTPATPLDLNTATIEQLDTLPGVGEVTAGHIVAYRSAHPFGSVDELLEVPGIGQRRFEQLKDLVTVG